MRAMKKPIEIEAYHVDGPELELHPLWLTEALDKGIVRIEFRGTPKERYIVKTHHGVACADRGDWIIRGVDGELYPCLDSIFAATYDVFGESA